MKSKSEIIIAQLDLTLNLPLAIGTTLLRFSMVERLNHHSTDSRIAHSTEEKCALISKVIYVIIFREVDKTIL